MLQLNDIVELEIEKLVYEGYGLAHKNNIVFFVDNACDGDIVEAKITKIKKNFVMARTEKVIKPSMYRVKPFCPLFNACGGCQWQFIDYQHQLKIKNEIVKEILENTLKRKISVEKTMASPNIKEFRHKIQMPVSQTKNSKRFLIGYYKKGSHNITNIKFCPNQPEIVNIIIDKIRESALKYNVKAYNEHNHKGELRHIIIKVSSFSGEIQICIVVNNNKQSDEIKKLAAEIFNNFDMVKGISLNFNQERNNIILGEKTETIIGNDFYIEKIGDIRYIISPESFFQVNPDSFKNILDKVKSIINERFNENPPDILDAYSGVGSFGLYLSDIANKITCVEEIPSACENTKKACEINNIDNIDIINGDAGEIFNKLINDNKKFDIIILDPPRKGCTSQAIESCIKLSKKYIIYVSCNPTSLARDLKMFEKNGFKLVFAQTADMFCHTYHIETITVIEKNPVLE